MNKKILALITLTIMITSGLVVLTTGTCNDSNASTDASFYIEDSNGNMIEFEQTSNHVILLGLGFTLSTIDLGCEDKIVGVDYYTDQYMKGIGETQYNDLDLGNYFNADGRTQIATAILQMSENGTFNLDTDWIIAPGYSYIVGSGGLIELLNEILGENNYNLITLVSSATSYDQVTEVVEDLSKIMGVQSSAVVDEMQTVDDIVTETIENNNLSGAAAIQISSSGKIYNSSLGMSIVTENLNGINAGSNGGSSSYSTDYSAILQMASAYSDTVIFVSESYSDISGLKETLNGYKIVLMESKWDNVCPDVTNCLWVIACALYPDYFSGDVPTVDSGSNENTILYLGAGMAVAIAAIIITTFVMKKH
ncbi:MAG: hypothetical protein M0P07_01055 [Candidatus Methanomethylophilaceae archaeon]|nr:hypothetical protein [Candidatus Cloacimonadota bacterium]MCK9322540.1 hypothetical protein [Candidatus Methanomethylophilaceae archaeon]